MDAALLLVAEAGFDRATIDAIAARAGASKATVYRRWPGKHELVADAIRRRVRPSPLRLPDTGSLRGDLLAAGEVMRQVMTSEPGLVFFGLLVAMRTDPELAALAREQLFPRRLPAQDNPVTRAVARGELPAGADPSLLPRVAAPLIFNRLMMMGGELDDLFLPGLVDDILIPLLSAGRSTAPGLPPARPASSGPE
jgi:AcrR family transcriptional regulator